MHTIKQIVTRLAYGNYDRVDGMRITRIQQEPWQRGRSNPDGNAGIFYAGRNGLLCFYPDPNHEEDVLITGIFKGENFRFRAAIEYTLGTSLESHIEKIIEAGEHPELYPELFDRRRPARWGYTRRTYKYPQ